MEPVLLELTKRKCIPTSWDDIGRNWVEKGKTSYVSAIGTWGAATHAYYDCK